MNRQQHWDTVYETKGERDVSWFEVSPDLSIAMIEAVGLSGVTCIIDIGGGESHLVDALVARGIACIAVLDVAGASLDRARTRLGAHASKVRWIEADVTAEWSWQPVDIWHDRAVFHFLTAREDRSRYAERLRAMLKPGGSAIIATFAPEGPKTCSGLPVVRYSPELLASELGDEFVLIDSRRHMHTTPWGATQAFQYSRFRRVGVR
jgi:SAM-dependent methyltransferase